MIKWDQIRRWKRLFPRWGPKPGTVLGQGTWSQLHAAGPPKVSCNEGDEAGTFEHWGLDKKNLLRLTELL